MRLAFDSFVLDTEAFELTREGAVQALARRPLDMLIHLVRHRNRVVTKAELLVEVWGGARVSDNSLAQAVASLRHALGPLGQHAIRAARGRGYRFVSPVVVLEAAPPASQAAARVLEPSPTEGPRSERGGAAPLLRVPARSDGPFRTFVAVIEAYLAMRPSAVVDGLSLAQRAARAMTRAEITGLVLSLFADGRQAPATIVVDHLERADVESLLLFTALAVRPMRRLALHGTCAWAKVCHDSAIAPLLHLALAKVPPSWLAPSDEDEPSPASRSDVWNRVGRSVGGQC